MRQQRVSNMEIMIGFPVYLRWLYKFAGEIRLRVPRPERVDWRSRCAQEVFGQRIRTVTIYQMSQLGQNALRLVVVNLPFTNQIRQKPFFRCLEQPRQCQFPQFIKSGLDQSA